MTRCKYRLKPVWHETQTLHEGKPVCVAESASALLLRLKGTRTVVSAMEKLTSALRIRMEPFEEDVNAH